MLSVTRRIVNHTRKYPLVCYQAPGFNGTTTHFKGYRVTHSSRSFVTRKSVVSLRANLFWSYRHSPHSPPFYLFGFSFHSELTYFLQIEAQNVPFSLKHLININIVIYSIIQIQSYLHILFFCEIIIFCTAAERWQL